MTLRIAKAHSRDKEWASAAHVNDDSLTFPQRVVHAASVDPLRVAMRQKRRGIYEEMTWAGYAEEICSLASAMKRLGLQHGDRFAIMGDARIEMVTCEMAGLAIGAVSVGVYATSSVADVRHILADSGAKLAIGETQEHVDKFLEVAHEFASLHAVILLDTRTKFLYDTPLVLAYDEVRESGRLDATSVLQDIARGQADDPAFILYTSGTTGVPKGVIHTHRTYYYSGLGYILATPELVDTPQRYVAHLSLAHGVSKCIVVCMPTQSMLVPHFPEEIGNFADTIKEVGPTYLILVPRYYQKFAAQLLINLGSSSRTKRRAYEVAMRIARRIRRDRWEGRKSDVAARLAYFLARTFVFIPLLDKIGFTHLRKAYTGSAPMPPEVHGLWEAWGLDLREVYGQTESGGLVLAHIEPWQKPGTIGCPLPDARYEVKLGSDGEILLRVPSNCIGYWGEDVAPTDSEGWLGTGDIAEVMDDGSYKIIDRKKSFINTTGGQRISPQQVENELKGSPFVSEAVVIGDGRRYLTALLELDFDTVSEWARQHEHTYTSYSNLVTSSAVTDLISLEVASANKKLARPSQVKYFRVIPAELDPEHGDTTATRKIMRHKIEAMLGELIEDMYSSTHGDEELVRAENV